MSWTSLLGLVVCNAIWAANPLMGKNLLQHFAPMQVSWLRYASAWTTIMIFLCFYRQRRVFSETTNFPITSTLLWVLGAGFVTFFGSGVSQYIGLSLSTSTANSLLVALEPLFAVLLAWIFLSESPRKSYFFAFLTAISGFLLLSNVKPHDAWATLGQFNLGNLLLLLSMPCEAMYTIASRKLAGRIGPLVLFAGTLTVGFIALTTYVLLLIGLPALQSLSIENWGAVIFMGPLGTTITYVYWSTVLKNASVAAVSLTLFVQPILGAAFGLTLLGERLDVWQIIGGALILMALVLQTRSSLQKTKSS